MSKQPRRRKSVSQSKQKNDEYNQRRNELDKTLHVVSHNKRKDGTFKMTKEHEEVRKGLHKLFLASLSDGKNYAGPSPVRRKELLQKYTHIPGEAKEFYDASVREQSVRRSEKHQGMYNDPHHFEWYYEDQGEEDVRYHYLFREINGGRHDQCGLLVEKGVHTWRPTTSGRYDDDGCFNEDAENWKNFYQKKKSKKGKKKNNRYDKPDPENYDEEEMDAGDDELGNDGDKQSQPKHARATKKKSRRQRGIKHDLHVCDTRNLTEQDEEQDQKRRNWQQKLFVDSFRQGCAGPSPARRAELRKRYKHVDAEEILFKKDVRGQSELQHQRRYKEARERLKEYDFDWYKETQGERDQKYHYYFRELHGKRFDERGQPVTTGVDTWKCSKIGKYDHDDGTFTEDRDDGAVLDKAESEESKEVAAQDDADDQLNSEGDGDVDYESVRDEVSNEQEPSSESGEQQDLFGGINAESLFEPSQRINTENLFEPSQRINTENLFDPSQEIQIGDIIAAQQIDPSEQDLFAPSQEIRIGDIIAAQQIDPSEQDLFDPSQEIQFGSINAESLLPLSREGTQGSDPNEVEPGSPRRREAKPLNNVEDHTVAPHFADFPVAAGVEPDHELAAKRGYLYEKMVRAEREASAIKALEAEEHPQPAVMTSTMKRMPRGDESEEEAKNGAYDADMRAKDKEIAALKEQVTELRRTVAHLQKQEQINGQLQEIIDLLSKQILNLTSNP